MKHLLLFIVTGVFFVSSFAQTTTRTTDWEWAPIGAVWYYETSNMFGEHHDIWSHYWYVRSAKDTLFQGVNCRKLEVVKFFYPSYEPVKMPSRYTYQDDGNIYFYNADLNEFVLSFSYDIQYGDTVEWQMPDGLNCSNSYWLDSVFNWDTGYLSGEGLSFIPHSIFMFSNTPISSYKLGYVQNSCYAQEIGYSALGLPLYEYGRYLDYIGTETDIFDLTIIEELQSICLCYYDGDVVINKAYRNSMSNDTIIYAEDSCLNYYNQFNSSILSEQEKEVFRIYPNPVKDYLHISISAKDSYSIKIITLEGQNLYYKKALKRDAKINLDYLEPGMYIISVRTKNRILTKRIIKL